MSIGQKLTEIVENMPDVYGKGFLMGQTQGYQNGYQEGAEKGGIEARAQCLMTHFATTFLGNGSHEVIAEIPFKPDIVTVYTAHSYTTQGPNCYRGFAVDLRGCGRYMCHLFYTDSEAIYRNGIIKSSLNGNVVSYENGIFRFHLSPEQLKNVIWCPHVRYHLVAVRFPEESGRQQLEEQIMLLPDAPPAGATGQLNYMKNVVYSYFTEEEWELLTAKKPNWTFILE